MIPKLTRSIIFIVLLLGVIVCATAHAQSTQKQGTGIITGRVMLGDKGAANVSVLVYTSERSSEIKAVARATTDFEGRYRLTDVPPGRYSVVPVAPTMVGSNEGIFGESGKAVTLAEGETVEKIDFSLTRGGVITGRITDADGAPVIGQRVNLLSVDKNQRSRGYSATNPYMYQTDDRGIYRLYGIAPGKYTISVGESPATGEVRFTPGRRAYFIRTYYPSVTDESKATIIEVTEGSESSNIDITLGRKEQTFSASGRVLDESGQPVPNVRVGSGAIMRDQNRMNSFGFVSTTDEQGRFRLDGMMAGRYAAFVWNTDENNSYSEPVAFEIAEGDVSGLELKLRRGATISGVAVIEGTTDKSVLAKLTQLQVSAASPPKSGTLAAPTFSVARIAPDGSFRISGLRAGKFRIYLGGYPPPIGFTLARVEREGVPQQEIEVASGAQVTGVRLVFEYGSGSIRGLVKIENGALPEGLRMNVYARRSGELSEFSNRGTMVDARGHFLIEGLPPGDYELTLQTYMVEGSRPRALTRIKQNVTVTNGVESEVNFAFDPNANPKEGGNNE